MTKQSLQAIIAEAWENPTIDLHFAREAVEEVFSSLDSGKYRIAEKIDGIWVVNDWLKKAIMLSFKFNENKIIDQGIFKYCDKISLIQYTRSHL